MSRRLNEMNEEFNNFMYKVTHVQDIVNKLASPNPNMREIGDLEAKLYLGEEKQIINEDSLQLRVSSNKTVLNRKVIDRDEDPNTKSQEAFMEEISKDADMRWKDKQRRRERMETLKKQANLAFRRGEMEKALSLYNKAIDQIKDSALLYQNRALTLINLNCLDKALTDCDWALKLNENSLKTWLLIAKAHFKAGNSKEFNNAVAEATTRNPEHTDFIQEYVRDLV